MDSFIPLEWNALSVFAAKGDLEAVTCLLDGTISSRADLREMTLVRRRFPADAVGLYGDTALHLAASNGHLPVVDVLLAHGADPSKQNDLGQTPLFCASSEGEAEVVSRLIAAGADMHRLSCDGNSARDVAATDECRFLFRALETADDEEAVARAAAARARLQLVLLRWAKAGMVNSFRSWRAFALVPQNRLARLLEDMDNFGAERVYDDTHGARSPRPPPLEEARTKAGHRRPRGRSRRSVAEEKPAGRMRSGVLADWGGCGRDGRRTGGLGRTCGSGRAGRRHGGHAGRGGAAGLLRGHAVRPLLRPQGPPPPPPPALASAARAP